MASFDPYGVMSGLTENTGLFNADPIGNFNFVLTVEGIYDIPLKSVRAFQKVNQYEKIREGGVNDYVYLKRAPIQDAHTIQFERYASASLFDPLANGAELAIPLILWLKRSTNNDYSKGGSDTSSVRLYIFTGATVMSKEYGALDAEHSGLLTEVITVGYKELYIVPNLITYFGGGAGNVGEMGELVHVDEDARKKFKEAQKTAHDAAEKANKDKKAEAAAAEEESRAKFASDTEAARKAAADANAKKAEEATKLAEENAKKFKEAQETASKAAKEAHETQAKAAEEKAKKDAEDAAKYVEDTAKSEAERLDKEEKARQEREQLNKANKARQDREAKRQKRGKK